MARDKRWQGKLGSQHRPKLIAVILVAVLGILFVALLPFILHNPSRSHRVTIPNYSASEGGILEKPEENRAPPRASGQARGAPGGDSRRTTGVYGDKEADSEGCQAQWRPEHLVGSCVGGTVSTEATKVLTSAAACKRACCEAAECVSWQFREDLGCLHGGDVRLGMEKDGPGAWCEPSAPAPWEGQRLRPHQGDHAYQVNRTRACSQALWDPSLLQGQCFGLGARRALQVETSVACMTACCADEDCEIWQWRQDKGCFFGKGGWVCDKPSLFANAPFQGLRKVVSTRKYLPLAYVSSLASTV
mmetsp:Transcript_30846/g.42727  ORF Transcript_30846/g.42727 Transcript_30846/m.42727 type:complete len:303 (+) Transcript_30846:560-1468(+)